MKRRFLLFLTGAAVIAGAASSYKRLRPPLWADGDMKLIAKPARQDVAELYALLNNSWLRYLSPEEAANAAHDDGALNVNAWDGVPDSSWFTNRIGRTSLRFEQLLAAIPGAPPEPGLWMVQRNEVEGYTPKLQIKDPAGRTYVLKFDLPEAPERNSAAERVSTLVLAAAGYNVPANFVVSFRPTDLRLGKGATFVDRLARKRAMTETDLGDVVNRIKVDERGMSRALSSLFIPGQPLGKFKYHGVRADDPNDIIPHELRRELRGLRVIASWINHADVGDKNTFDTFLTEDGITGYVRHYLLDFGSTLGSGNYINGPYRVGHEHVFDGPAIAKTFFTFGAWRRPWEAQGQIPYTEIGYFTAHLFSPAEWRPNYPNLAFLRMDEGDAYWGTRIVLSFTDSLISKIVREARFTRPEVTQYLTDTLKQRRDMIGRHWLTHITPLDEFRMVGDRLAFRDLGLERGYAETTTDRYRCRFLDSAGKPLREVPSCDGSGVAIRPSDLQQNYPSDVFGRTLSGRLSIDIKAGKDRWASPVTVALGYQSGAAGIQVLGWSHGMR